MQIPSAAQMWTRLRLGLEQTQAPNSADRSTDQSTGQPALQSTALHPAGKAAQTVAQDTGRTAVATDAQSGPHRDIETPQDTQAQGSASHNIIRDAAHLFAKYDLSRITPKEIDTLAADLKTARFDDLGFVMALERHGAAYHAEMMASGSIYSPEDPAFDAEAPVDLIKKTRRELALAQRYGQDTDRLASQVLKLEAAQMSRAASAPSGMSNPQLAETLVLFQAQRLWIE
ncbi:hypothetical protein Q4560_03125 [Celeribacter halophilus]|uniref:Uncharacterized protein n=1 Tax=Celeribacter halophilus TaxID=576117 RepID=A0AAW7XWC6_9RHOB|nr:hypothetical protein [Celeribacter halophilus]MDO6457299.1 hypothetical protein [Celeribacter halophilus]MDO6722249.1 hypothetical protein [Celeribacter halophilus]